MSDPDEKPMYTVEPDENQFAVVDEDGSVQVMCREAANAEQYAVLMNAAFRRGYKAGVRSSRIR